MNNRNDKVKRTAILLAISIFLVPVLNAQTLPIECFDNQNDYSFMWREKPLKPEISYLPSKLLAPA